MSRKDLIEEGLAHGPSRAIIAEVEKIWAKGNANLKRKPVSCEPEIGNTN
jgi:hypothetical protein